jgi:hypothetical protein
MLSCKWIIILINACSNSHKCISLCTYSNSLQFVIVTRIDLLLLVCKEYKAQPHCPLYNKGMPINLLWATLCIYIYIRRVHYHVLLRALPHTATHCRTQRCALSHTTALPNTHCRTPAHCRTATHCCTVPHCHTCTAALPHTAAHCRTLPHCRTAAHCRAHCHTLPRTLLHAAAHCCAHYYNNTPYTRPHGRRSIPQRLQD